MTHVEKKDVKENIAERMHVIKRNGAKQLVHFDKIHNRIRKLCYGLQKVDPTIISLSVIAGLSKGMHTSELDDLAAETAASLSADNFEYSELAARIAISNLHKSTSKKFSIVAERLHGHVNIETNEEAPMLSKECYEFIKQNKDELDAQIVHDRDALFDYFGFRTIKHNYLIKLNGKIEERPQHLFMRVACGIHHPNLMRVIETYDFLSRGFFIHATPTLFNAGLPNQQLASCFLLTMKEDSIEGIYETLKECAQISKNAGGIGVAVHNIRASGSYIKGTGGRSNGLVPMLRVFNTTARYVDQGGGKRKGAFAVYLEPWHADIFSFLDLKKNTGIEENRARDLFYGWWIPDLFMERVEKDQDWSLFCPHEAPGLSEKWGEAFKTLYESYEAKEIRPGKKLARQVIKARQLWDAMLATQTETGVPYMLYKDSCNAKSNQQNLGCIKSSNLCAEIVEYTSPDEIAVCNLASIALPKFVGGVNELSFDFPLLVDVTKVITRNIDNCISRSINPIQEAKNSNDKHRPEGIGVQGLADVFLLLRLPYDSVEARQLNKDIFETIYFAACCASMELAIERGPYESFWESPMAQGKFQFDLWGVEPSSRYNWSDLRSGIMKHGMRNSLLIALMPTVSTSQMLGNNESFEPYSSLLEVRRTLAGEFVRVSKHLVRDLSAIGLWDLNMKQKIIANNGSVQNILEIPEDLRLLHRTAFEIKMRDQIDMAADRGAYICQSQSFNVHMCDITNAKLTSMHFYAWKKGLKTGMYYLRSKAATNAIKFTVDPSLVKAVDPATVVITEKRQEEKESIVTFPIIFPSSTLPQTTTQTTTQIKTPLARLYDVTAPTPLIFPSNISSSGFRIDTHAATLKRQRQEEEVLVKPIKDKTKKVRPEKKPKKKVEQVNEQIRDLVCSRDNKDCPSCSS